METKEAILNLQKLEDSIRALRLNATALESAQKRVKQLEDNSIEYKKSIENYRTDSIRYKRYFTLLSVNKEIEICKECDGLGGFDWEDGYGGGGSEPCKNCDTTGIVSKAT